jgi:hypothetical protein
LLLWIWQVFAIEKMMDKDEKEAQLLAVIADRENKRSVNNSWSPTDT